jgi:iron complex outermembrane recepter protein
MCKRNSTLIGAAVALALFKPTAPAYSQAATTPSSNRIEEVVVTGIRGSLRQSLETKREAVGVVDALTAEDVGKFPDKNVAEALQRVPGVVINREFGEGERVSVRGTPTSLTKTMLNGHTVATADWFLLEQLNTTRAFNYLMLPAEIIGQVNVNKSSQADFEEGGIGATIDVRTRNPLDLQPFELNLSAQAAYTELADKYDPQASGLFSWKNSAETWGVLVAAIYQQRNIRRDGVEVLGYFDVDADPGPAVDNVSVPSLIGSSFFKQERTRTGGNIALQFRPSDSVDVNLTGLYSKFDADNINQNFLAWGFNAINGGGALSDFTRTGNTAVAGTVASANAGTTGRAAVYDAIDRFASAETISIDLDTQFRPSEDWTVHLKVGYTEASGDTEDQILSEFGQSGVFQYDLRGRAPQVTFVPNANGARIDPADPSTMNFDFGNLNEFLNDDDETYAYVDALKKLDVGFLKSLKFGAKYTDHNRELVSHATTYGTFFVPLNTTGCDGGPCSAPFFAGPSTPGDYLDDIASAGTLRPYWQVNQQRVEEVFFDNFTGRILYPQQNYSITEKSYAGYVMGNLGGKDWRGNVGVRVVRTEQTSSGNQIGVADPEVINPFGNYTPVTVERTYTDVLPSLNLAYDVKDDIVLRFAAARAMTRPDFNDIAPRITLNSGALTGSAGDPLIDPYRANQFDLSIEWYPESGTAYALAVFYKDLVSHVIDAPVTQVLPVSTANPVASCVSVDPSNQLFDCPFVINKRINTTGRISGFEVALTRPLWGGFGVQTNYTFSDSEAAGGAPVPGASEDQFNFTAYFENQRLSARASYTYRSEFLVAFDRSTLLSQAALESVDVSVSVNVMDNIALTFDGVNLTNDKIIQYADQRYRPRAIYDNGRIFFAGVRAKF